MKLRPWIHRVGPYVPWVVMLSLASSVALARGGGGEHYDSGRSGDSGGDGDGGFILQLLIEIAFRHPCIGIPLILIFIGVVIYMKAQDGSASTRRALDRAEAEQRTTVAARDVDQWVAALKAKDPAFDLIAFFDRTKKLFIDVQDAWFKRNLEPVRRWLSDATYTRLASQLKLLDVQGVRDAIADTKVFDLQIIGLEQTPFFDTVQIRIKASLRDDDAPSTFTDDQARELAMKKAPDTFTEVWSFVRRPGAQTKGENPGTCPNCGAPFAGGAANTCEFCRAVVNSGNYDWVLAEITQGSEFVAGSGSVDGLARMRQTDPELTTEALEDRASLCFWRWIDAQVSGDAGRVSKVASDAFSTSLKAELLTLSSQQRHKVFLECAVGGVTTRAFTGSDGFDLAHVEVRWSAKMGVGVVGQKPPSFPSVPQRSVFVLQRKSGAHTPSANGLSTGRCPNCAAPFSDNASTSCEFCGTVLSSGERDWVIREISSWESWRVVSRSVAPRPTDRVPDKEERQRLLYMMAAMAAADGVIDNKERALLTTCAARWGIPFANVEMALKAGPQLFERLVQKGTPEAESFLRQLVEMALVDGKIDRKERHMLEAAASHLGLSGRLGEFLGGK